MSNKLKTTQNVVHEQLSEDAVVEKIEVFHVAHPKCVKTIRGKKASLSKDMQKTYKVTVTYIRTTEEEAKRKLAIIERIMKKNYKNG